MTTLTVRIPDDLGLILEKTAHAQERSKAWLVKKAIQNYLEDLADYETADREYNKFLTSGEESIDLDDLAKDLGVDLKNYKKSSK